MLLTVTSPPTSNAQVTEVTRVLAWLRFLPAQTSVYTPAVSAAVRAFQTRMGILADGKVGPQTLTLLVLVEQLFSDAGRRAAPEAILALSIVWHESGFYPWAQLPPKPAAAKRYGLFLLDAATPGNPRVVLPIGTKQLDGAVRMAIDQILAQWATGLKALQGVAQLVAQLTGFTATPAGQTAWWLRLVALGHKLQGSASCLQALLSAPSVKAAGYAWPAIAAHAGASANPLCTAAYQSAIASGYVDRVMTTAAHYAAAFGLPTVYYTSDRGIEAVASPAPATVVTPSTAVATAPSSPAPSSPAEQPPAQATLPPELQPGPGDKLPITTGVPAIPSVPPGTQMVPAGPSGGDSGSGWLILAALLAVAVAAGGKSGAGKRSSSRTRSKRR